MIRNLLVLFTGILLVSTCTVDRPGFLHVQDTKIVDAQGNEVILRGMGLGGWMLQEGYMLEIYRKGTQHEIRQQIADLIGERDCEKFYDLWLQNHVTRADIDSMAKWGFNSIRLPMHYNLFTLPVEKEPVAGRQTWLGKGFILIDSLLSWCKANGLYLILDLHAAPGGQGKDRTISDYDTTKASLWESRQNKEKTVALWRKLAERYAREPNIGGYDLINEPNWTFEAKDKHGREDSINKPIWDLYAEIIRAIREVDQNHMVIVEGNGWGNNYRGFPGAWDKNMVLSFHKYWNPNRQENIAHILEARDRYGVPVWVGESGENSNKWFTDAITLLENNEIGWAWWPLKKINSVVCPLTVVTPESYNQLTGYWNGQAPRPSRQLARDVLFAVAENLKAQHCHFNRDVIDAMFRQRRDTTTLPFASHDAPCRIYATDYDLGYPGRAYVDKDCESTGEPGSEVGNKSHKYRNDGVDIETCNDSPEYTNGYCVTSVEEGEWLKYTFFEDTASNCNMVVRLSNANGTGLMTLELDGNRQTSEIPVEFTGSSNHWKTVNAREIWLDKGQHTLKLLTKKGGFKLNYIELQQ
jgi:hypothetical protein